MEMWWKVWILEEFLRDLNTPIVCIELWPGPRKKKTDYENITGLKMSEPFNHCWLYCNLQTLPKLLWPNAILPDSKSLHSRQPTRTVVWMLPSIRTSLSWLSWKASTGAPNCFLSFFQKDGKHRRGDQFTYYGANSTQYFLPVACTLVLGVVSLNWALQSCELQRNKDSWWSNISTRVIANNHA